MHGRAVQLDSGCADHDGAIAGNNETFDVSVVEQETVARAVEAVARVLLSVRPQTLCPPSPPPLPGFPL